jgi:pimeloyl-ACP methyl ester carboxylesterase
MQRTILASVCAVLLFMSLNACAKKSPPPEATFTREFLLSIPGDTTQQCALCLVPKGNIRGVIMLLSGFGTSHPVGTEQETEIPQIAAAKGFLTIIPQLGDWSTLYLDSTSQQALERVLRAAMEKYHLQGKPLILGGFSLGGSGAVLYAERALRSPSILRPTALFAIDPPLDFERFTQNAAKAIQRLHLDRIKDAQKDEYLYLTTALAKAFGGGTIYTNPAFRDASPYIRSDTTLANIRSLANLPFRFYHEPDYHYWRERNPDDDFQSNVLDQSSMIADLHSLGNTNATLILTEGKGFRRTENNRRHPHSWSVADAQELVQWIENNCGEQKMR